MKLRFMIGCACFGVSLLTYAQPQAGAPAAMTSPPSALKPTPDVSAGATPDAQVFRIRVLDGRNGAPIQSARVKVWYDEPAGPGIEIATGANGYALMPAPIGEPLRVLAEVSNFTDCRRPERYAPPEGYSLAGIAKSGIAVGNTCGRIAEHTRPGELVLFARPERWYERLNRTPE